MDLFETVRDQLGCEYISDMRSCRALLNDAKKVVASLDLEAYTAWELADMAEYLYGKKMYGAEKDIIISFLKKYHKKSLWRSYPHRLSVLLRLFIPTGIQRRAT